MSRRVSTLAAAVAVVAILFGVAVRGTGAFDEVAQRTWTSLDRDPGIADGFVVIGMTEANGWDRYSAVDGDADAIRRHALVTTIQELARDGAALIVLTELLDTEDIDRAAAEDVTRAIAQAPVLPAFLDSAPLDLDRRDDATFASDFRAPLKAADDVPLAHVVVPTGTDLVRSVPLMVRHTNQGTEYRLLTISAAAVLALAEGVDRAASQQLQPSTSALEVGAVRIPVTDGQMRITWSPQLTMSVPGTTTPDKWSTDLPFVSAEQYLDKPAGQERAERVAGKVVLVGSINPLNGDYWRVPGGPDGGIPELWLHANALNTILTGKHRVPAGMLESLGWLALLALAGAALTARFSVGRATVWVALLAIGHLTWVSVRLGAGVLLDPVPALLALLAAWGGTFAARYAVEGRQRRRVATLFKSYVPETVADQLIEQRVSLEALAAGQRVDLSVVFCDLRGFTAHAATLEPPDVRDLLNVYYRHMATIILERAGTVMQYVGDEVFAIFGAPLHQEDHAERAVEAATRMQDAAAEIAAELAGSGIAPISYGIGVHSGSVVAAHVGDDLRRQYSVVGDTVNVGARLCSQAKTGEVVISEDVVARLPEAGRWARQSLELDQITDVVMKGVSRDFGIYRLRW